MFIGGRLPVALPPQALLVVLLFGIVLSCANAASPGICRIEVVEQGTGWPVPLVELRTTHQERFVTDNDGVIAFDLPELMGRKTWFDVIGQGYQVPKDGLGMSGVQLTPEPGKTLRVEVTRAIIARRIGRLTGGGLFAESQKLGDETGWRESGVLGCDSVQNAVYRGKLFWLWGDTALSNYPLGIFDCSCATTSPQPLTQFQPPLKVLFDEFRDKNGNPRGVARMPGPGPTWLAGMVAVPDSNGLPHLVATYMKIKPPLEAYEWGLCAWNDATKNFERLRVLWKKSATSPRPPPVPDGHAAFWTDNNGRQWLLFGNPLPCLRCPATFEDWQNTNTWETLTPQKYFTSATDPDGSQVEPHAGSIAWNPWRRRWVTVFEQINGKPSMLGEIWYAEAETDSPLGQWGKAVKVLSHDNYTFYNPCIHPEFTASNSPVLIFEGTYSRTFAANPPPTPRYDYNQILYRLDLDDPRLVLAHGDHDSLKR